MYIDCFWKETKRKPKTKPRNSASSRDPKSKPKEEDLTFHFLPAWIFLTMYIYEFYQRYENIILKKDSPWQERYNFTESRSSFPSSPGRQAWGSTGT